MKTRFESGLYSILLVTLCCVVGCTVEDPLDESAYLFDQSEIRTYDIQLTEENLAILDENPFAETYVEGGLIFEGTTYENLGVRYKGGVGSWITCVEGFGGKKICPKLSMKVKFNWQDPDRLFMGVRKLQLHAMNADPSLLRERLAYSLYRDMGVEACRTAHARVLINGEFVGLFILVEQIDGRFTRAHFPEEGGKGNLYKEAWPVHRDPQYYLDRLRTNEEDDPSVDKMVLLADEIAETEEDNLPAVLERWFEIEYTMRQVVVEWAIGRDDGVYNWLCFGRIETACYNHNFYLYEEEENNRLWLIPWDLDLSFKGSNGFVGPVIDQWDDVSPECVVVPISTGMGPIGLSGLPPNCDPILRGLTHFQADYAALMKELLDGPFSETSVTAKLDTWQEQILPYVEEASAVHGADELSVSDWEVAVLDLRKTIDSLRTKHASDIN